ncbi:MAG: hypothetical protein FWD61_02350 [Phycisphaerales bacterium]|nr:hypothetical protein [Phycisphaerales bacterium]
MTTTRSSPKKTKKPTTLKNLQQFKLRLPRSDVFVDGKRLSFGPTLPELLAKKRRAQSKSSI